MTFYQIQRPARDSLLARSGKNPRQKLISEGKNRKKSGVSANPAGRELCYHAIDRILRSLEIQANTPVITVCTKKSEGPNR